MAEHAQHDYVDQVRALGVVGFELRMMAHASARIRKAPPAHEDPVEQNAYIDSERLHARALIDFFLKVSKRASDIRRTDFAPDWTACPNEAVKRLNDHYLLLHKHLAHLTWERVSKDAKPWDYPHIADDVIEVADAWSNHLAPVNRTLCETFRPHVELARKTMIRDA